MVNLIEITSDNIMVVNGLPTCRIVGDCLEFVDRDKRRSQARGTHKVRVSMIDIIRAMKAKAQR